MALIDLQRVGLATAPVKRQHQLPSDPLALRRLGQQSLKLAHQL
jgi:hypothetical protein